MQSEPPLVQVNFTDEFQRRLRTLSKKYRHIRSDIQPTIAQLQAGDFVGDQISGTGNTVFKVRVRNSDIQKGKSGGYRLIYQLESPTNVILLLIYSKSEQADVAAEEIKLVIEEFQKEGSSSSEVNQE
ncbi:type II toxin-antitoxin system RelE/ParE family toxin [Mastigocladus laminosus UU774]|nr:type II toxin-antitoxin system RelE/ParE family toxin [Mastigocladus laminosus UU774]